MSWLQYHSQSEKYASSAHVAKFERDFDRARHFFRLAAEQEELALASLDPGKRRTLGITVVSAAALWYKASEYERSREIASRWVGEPGLSPSTVYQLKELLAEIESVERLMKDVEKWRASVPVSLADRERLVKAVEDWKASAA